MTSGRHYIRKGDRFTRLVQEGGGPPTVRIQQHETTGRRYYIRVKVEDCQAVTLQELARLVGSAAQLRIAVSTQALEWLPTTGQIALVPLRDGALRLISLTTSPSGRGVRVWLSCPRCGQRCGAVYASRWGSRGEQSPSLLIGCRSCLGLTDASRQQHKTLAWSQAVLGERLLADKKPYQVRSDDTRARAVNHRTNFQQRTLAALGEWADFLG